VDPEKAEKVQLETMVVNLASLITRAGDGDGVFNEGPLKVDPVSWDVTRISPEDCISLIEQIEEETLEVLNIFFP
jgi:hypothetical protein